MCGKRFSQKSSYLLHRRNVCKNVEDFEMELGQHNDRRQNLRKRRPKFATNSPENVGDSGENDEDFEMELGQNNDRRQNLRKWRQKSAENFGENRVKKGFKCPVCYIICRNQDFVKKFFNCA